MTRVAIVAALLIALSHGASAQNTVTIAGRVLDSRGRPVTQVTITAAEAASGAAADATQAASDGSFTLRVPAGAYVLTTTAPPPPLLPTHVSVDARAGSVTNVLMLVTAQTPVVPDEPPRAALIQVAPEENGQATITGAAGSVAPRSLLILVTLDSGHAATAQADHDGSFRVSMFAPFGSSVLVKNDPFGFAYRTTMHRFPNRELGPQISLMAGTIVRAPEPPPSGTGVRFGRAGTISAAQPGQNGLPAWTFDGAVLTTAVAPGETLQIDGTVRIASPSLQEAGTMFVNAGLRLDRLSGPDGSSSPGAQNTYASTILTPTDLPIERNRNGRAGEGLDRTVRGSLVKTAADRAEAAIRFAVPLPKDMPAGLYLPVVRLSFDNVPVETPPGSIVVAIDNHVRREVTTTYLPPIRVGSPARPRLPALLLADTLSNGVRGVRALEDRTRFALSSRLRMGDALVVSRVDESGEPLRHRLEPYLPTVSLVVV